MIAVAPDRVDLHLRLTPAASQDRVDGPVTRDDGRTYLSVRVRARPDKGEANAALIAFLANWAGCSKRDIELVRGSTSRTKTLRFLVTGAAQTSLIAKLEACGG